MKTFHVHIKVDELQKNIAFYSQFFNTQPTVVREDYAKWMLDDPRLNFAISLACYGTGLAHLGFGVDSQNELKALSNAMSCTEGLLEEEGHVACCYAQSEKTWLTDPQGISWEVFHTYGLAEVLYIK